MSPVNLGGAWPLPLEPLPLETNWARIVRRRGRACVVQTLAAAIAWVNGGGALSTGDGDVA